MKNILNNLWRKLVKREIEILNRISDLIDLSIKSIDVLLITIDDEGDIDIALKTIEEYEKMGDEIVSVLTDSILGGAIMIPLQNYVLKLIDILDDILDTIHVISIEEARKKYFRRIRSKKALEIENKIYRYLKLSRESITKLKILIENIISGEWIELLPLTKEIERMEEEGDDFKNRIIEEIYMNWHNIREPYFSYLTNYTYMIDQIQDLTEDASNMLLMLIQHMRT